MGCRALELVDEPHCLQVACPHPCCWETERRVAGGTLRYVKAVARAGTGERSPEKHPTLSVVNACEWANPRAPPRGSVLHKASTRGNSLPDSAIVQTSSHASQQGQSVAAGSPKTTSVPHSAGAVDKKCKAAKLSQAQIGPLHSRHQPGSVMMWIPNPQHNPLPFPQHRSKTPHVAITQLSCSLFHQLTLTPQMDKKKSKAGRQKVRFQVHSSPGESVRKTSPGPGGTTLDGVNLNGLIEDTTTSGKARGASERDQKNQQSVATAKARREFLENKTAVFHSMRDWRLRTLPPQHASAPQNKPDSKNLRGSADRQSNLWNRYNPPSGCTRDRLPLPVRPVVTRGIPKASQGPASLKG